MIFFFSGNFSFHLPFRTSYLTSEVNSCAKSERVNDGGPTIYICVMLLMKHKCVPLKNEPCNKSTIIILYRILVTLHCPPVFVDGF